MDIDDLFGAFEGEERVNDVHEAEPTVTAVKRKTSGEGDGKSGGGSSSKRQAVLEVKEGRVEEEGAASKRLVEGSESSTVREDGTLVKSVSKCKSGVGSMLKARAAAAALQSTGCAIRDCHMLVLPLFFIPLDSPRLDLYKLWDLCYFIISMEKWANPAVQRRIDAHQQQANTNTATTQQNS